MCSTKENDPFLSSLHDVMNKTITGSCIALGSSLGIFDIMATFKTPQSHEAIAEKGEWKPRYIKEWLNVMVVSNIVEYDRSNNTYFIPENHKPFLSKQGGSKNFAVTLEIAPLITAVREELASCFPINGPDGIPHEKYAGFHEWKTKAADNLMTWKELQSALEGVPGLVQKLGNGGSICDGGCSSGHHSLVIAEEFPKANVVGFDISQHAIDLAKETAQRRGITNIAFEVVDACDLPCDWKERFNIFLVVNVVHDLPFPEKFLQGAWSALKPGGMLLMVDTKLHTNVEDSKRNCSYAPWFYGSSLFHCVPISMGIKGGAGLGCTWGIEKQVKMLEDTGFIDVTQLQVQSRTQSYHIGHKPKN